MASGNLVYLSENTRLEADIRRARRYEALASEMEATFREWLMPHQDQFVMSLYVGALRDKAESLRRMS